MTAPRSEILEATGRPNFPEACASSCSIALTRAYAVRFYACAYVPASVVHGVRVRETCNERKEAVGRNTFARSASHVGQRRPCARASRACTSKRSLAGGCFVHGLSRRGEAAPCSERLGEPLFDRFVLNVVLGRVVVRQLVDHVEALEKAVVDLHERLPLLRQC